MNYRFATREDTPQIFSMIRELAAYEGMENEVVGDERTLEEWVFDKGGAEVIFALDGETPVGFALFFHNFSTFLCRSGLYLEDLYVKPAYRGRGFGKGLIDTLAAIAKERGYGRMEWWCLDSNTPSVAFYRALGAEPMSDWTVFRLAGETLARRAEEAGNP